jgi:hypothetical protein
VQHRSDEPEELALLLVRHAHCRAAGGPPGLCASVCV